MNANPTAKASPLRRLGLAPLMRLNIEGTDIRPLYQHLIQKATDDPDDSCSLLDASIILQLYSQTELALQLQREALRMNRHYRYPTLGTPRLRLLALMVPGVLMANIPVECLLENSDVELIVLYATDGTLNLEDIPDHDVLLVAISEQDENRDILAAWSRHLVNWPRPVLNNPCNIKNVGRDTAAGLLSTVEGVIAPTALRIDRTQLQNLLDDPRLDAPLKQTDLFPLLIRPVDSHAGINLSKVNDAAELRAAFEALSDDEFFLTQFVDYRSTDGQYRKYRVMLIDGQPFIGHMAISDHWMIHYLNAGMAENAEKRAEEARVMANFDSEFAQRHAQAFAGIHSTIGLDYLGIDCAETPRGDLLVFEIEHSMVVHAMDSVELYPYKPAAMRKLFAAFRAMLFKAAGIDPTEG